MISVKGRLDLKLALFKLSAHNYPLPGTPQAFTSTWHATDPLAEYIRGALAARDSETEEHVAHRIAAAESAAKQQERTRYQDLLVRRVARDLSNSREATRIHETFRRFDVNKDGHISKEEFAFIMVRRLYWPLRALAE